ncbi:MULTISPECIES: phosphatidylinositol-specific phospholipase C domain-containing protein [Nitrospirillum]|uniref:1-phosphatidylinositol phosphodiesterase n=1 Tax=Nitrospirillum amazonense TaxID=28077 RepID=A0A560FKR7_9PROT|nr:phosphatidylinositol-specific phospholipase C domain-containing protein [Nitrospirillum amazonense]MEC4590815.1 phosphatidylinositol-specific phospholipase C domain-containing protein [Nitrospirillum amazonense]TWB22201.1 hypothetical protein FBZ88_11631 [Nitrospirillum amazonense]
MIAVQFGLGLEYDTGYQPSVAMNASGLAVEVHQSEGASSKLWSRVGRIEGLSVIWGPVAHFDEGEPAHCALNNAGVVVEVHASNGFLSSGLWYHVGSASPSGIEWGGSNKYDSGAQPAIAINDAGDVMEVHKSQSNSGLWYRTGKVTGKTIAFNSSVSFGNGSTPKVALNNQGTVVVVYQGGGSDLLYAVGHLRDGKQSFGPARSYDQGAAPSVALSDDGLVVEVHESQTLNGLWQRVGRVVGDSIEWIGGATEFDNGAKPSVAVSGNRAVQVHQGELAARSLWSSVSLLADRAKWMENNMPVLGSRRLGEIVMSASHDAGMYEGNVAGLTQNLDMYDQLSYGVRYFDLRPSKFINDFYIYHGFAAIRGPLLSKVLDDVAKFMSEGHRELVILKLSHYSSLVSEAVDLAGKATKAILDVDKPDLSLFNQMVYRELANLVESKIGKWLVKEKAEKPLRDLSLAELTQNGGRVLVVCDGGYPLDIKRDGLWVYRDWQDGDANKGDLIVYDQYSNTTSFSDMQSDQFKNFKEYTGKCKSVDHVCDMFLLSWTLTPATAVWLYSKEANRELAASLGTLSIPNSHKQIVNLLYVDYVQYSRATDIALLLNHLPGFAA